MLISLMNNEKFPWKSIFLLGYNKKNKKNFQGKKGKHFLLYSKPWMALNFPEKGRLLEKEWP